MPALRSAFVERKRRRVDAVAESRGLGSIGKDVAQMRAAAGAGGLDPPHSMRQVFVVLNRVLVSRQVEAGPAAGGVKLRVRLEEQRAAARAVVGSVVVVVVERA